MDQNTTQRSPSLLRYFWPEPLLLCMRPWKRIDMGRNTVRARRQSTQNYRYSKLCRFGPQERLARLISGRLHYLEIPRPLQATGEDLEGSRTSISRRKSN